MKKFIALALTICMAVSLAACGKSKATDGEQVTKEAELNIMMSFPQYMDQWETYCKQFEDKMLKEENIKVKVNLEMPSSDQYDSVLQARLSGDDAPDLYTLHSNNISAYAKAGNLADISKEALADKIYDNVKETVSTDGKLYAVPIESQAWGVLYNKDIFKDCGLSVPETLDDLKNVCEVLKGKGYTPFLLAFQEQWVPQLMTALTIGGKVSGETTDWLKRMYKDQGSYEEIKDIFDPIDLIIANGTDRAMEEGSEAASADFANGKAAMFVQGTWAAQTIMTTNADMHMGVFPLPINNNKDCTLVNLSTSTTLGVYPGSKELDLALKFANYVLDDKDSSALFKSCSFNPLATCHNYESSSWVAEASKYVEEGRSYQDLVLPSAVTDEQGKLLQAYYVGSITKEDIIKDLDKTFKDANALN
ncbi:ABC transporter substrate-binding protein [Anaerocolumna sp. MB42-C2]|uniref:ABC transporter substrate-binding protein n=1 Tax=Anaerocolumna sp. MB42-C2 TaxID=3070997 RepID=UPI0027DF64DF|nr:extracellular solute-binding protein [Anaerocolumna sp. MB42-C2]WMJ88375.1 extracellular solute-binding protein [Anaerocolumna sp. MB42-C2]